MALNNSELQGPKLIYIKTNCCAIKLEEDFLFDASESQPLYQPLVACDRNIAPTTLASHLLSLSIQLSRHFSCAVVDRTLG